jgi:ATP-dependent RNA helicase SUPV3L1/SUV3
MEVFFTFTWAPNRGARRGQGTPRREARGTDAPRGDRGGRPARGDRSGSSGSGEQADRPRGKGGKPKGKGKPHEKRDGGGKSFEARPPRKEKPIDPDNPFAAALMGLRDKT